MNILHENDLLLLCPEIFLALTAMALLVYGVLFSNEDTLMLPSVTWVAALAVAFAFVLHVHAPVTEAYAMFNHLIFDDLTFYCKAVILLGSAVSLLFSIHYFENESINGFEYAVLMLLSTASMCAMVSSFDLLSLYLTIELQSLCFYVLAASKRDSQFSTEAGLKYFLLGAFSSGILLFGMSLLYGFTGCSNFGAMTVLFTGFGGHEALEMVSANGVVIGALFLGVGFLFKLSAAPFHMWAPDVYEGAPTAVTAFFSIVPKVAFFGIFLRLFALGFHDLLFPWQTIMLLASFLSMLVGSFGALSQTRIKRVLAFSSIGHVGYMLLALSCGTVEGIQSLLVYLGVYVVMTACTFGVLLAARSPWGSLRSIHDLSVLSRANPALAVTFALCLFSMAGVPPLAGFASKFYVFFAGMGAGLYPLSLVGVLTSCVSAFYYLRLIKIMYFDAPAYRMEYAPMSREMAVIMACCLSVVVFFFAYPAPLFVWTHKVALSLMV